LSGIMLQKKYKAISFCLPSSKQTPPTPHSV
jgi:hypothetical protein